MISTVYEDEYAYEMGNGEYNGYLFRISDRLEVFAHEPEANVLLAVLAAQKFLRETRDETR